MQVCSTRDPAARLSFSAALLAGLPPDGGLYQPAPPPDLRREIAALPDQASFVQVAAALSAALFAEELAGRDGGAAGAARALAEAAFPFAPVLSWLGDGIALLELFHGPTCAFKDFGAAFLAALLERGIAGSPGGRGRSGPRTGRGAGGDLRRHRRRGGARVPGARRDRGGAAVSLGPHQPAAGAATHRPGR